MNIDINLMLTITAGVLLAGVIQHLYVFVMFKNARTSSQRSDVSRTD